MSKTEIYFFRDDDGSLPLVEWLDELPEKVQLKCTQRISRLAELGNELRRPEADYLRDEIYELRASFQGVHYRVLYFFAGRAVVVLSHGITKEREVPNAEINRAIQRKGKVESDFKRYTFKPA
ncbi:MAG TPA: type II toxin-antitoxin system RelE/ParE family toxin [Terriglobia bacterium]|nr:type II toxin-antitoxin system RelE/ParE family toxin [Terriglobia bacterium]